MNAKQIAAQLEALAKDYEAGNISMFHLPVTKIIGLIVALAERVALLESEMPAKKF